jgi:hypothetical protein
MEASRKLRVPFLVLGGVAPVAGDVSDQVRQPASEKRGEGDDSTCWPDMFAPHALVSSSWCGR